MSLTANVETENYGTLVVPCDPHKFGKELQYSQEIKTYERHRILFNKGRYFETSISNKGLRDNISQLTGIPVQYTNMIIGNWKQMEDFVIAMNIHGYYVEIDIDWI